MSSDGNSCANCGALEARVNQLEAEISRLQQEVKRWQAYTYMLAAIIRKVQQFALQVEQHAKRKREAGNIAPAEFNRLRGIEEMAHTVAGKLSNA